ncbi:MAG: hypothetical protein NPIRA05_13410 [Nitrospirales bacterium]|nr:MAG: hypothetical protein NPIRA05_13410 [Nitrospirales bacterium]
MKIIKLLSACALLFILNGGCINLYVQDENFSTTEDWPLERQKSQTIGLNLTAEYHSIPDPPTAKSLWWVTNEYVDSAKSLLQIGFLQAHHTFDSSNLFKETQVGVNNPDYVANIHIIWTEKRPESWSIAHAVTLGILPARNSRSMKVQMSIIDTKGKLLGTYEKSSEVIAWRGLILLPISPFWIWWDDDPAEQVLFDIFREMIVEAHAQEVF